MRSLHLQLNRIERRLSARAPSRCSHCGLLRGPSRSGPCVPGIVLPDEEGDRTLVICKMCGWCYRARLEKRNGIWHAEEVEEALSPV